MTIAQRSIDTLCSPTTVTKQSVLLSYPSFLFAVKSEEVLLEILADKGVEVKCTHSMMLLRALFSVTRWLVY